MRLVVQRVSGARVLIGGSTVGSIGAGLVVFVGISRDDLLADADYLIDKLAKLRIFADSNGKMNLNVRDVSGALLIVSQFTLYADCSRGRRPSFERAAPPDRASELYQYFVEGARRTGIPVQTGLFQESMQVELTNMGPVTIWLDSAEGSRA